MTYEQITKLLENAIDFNSTSEYHTGFTAREIHRKSLNFIRQLKKDNDTLKDRLDKPEYRSHLGWGKGKDE